MTGRTLWAWAGALLLLLGAALVAGALLVGRR